MVYRSAAQRCAVFAFMGVVTWVLVTFAFTEADRGLEGVTGILVYGLAAGFGLEFLGSAWRGFWPSAGTEPDPLPRRR
jgi:hypothetical protein